MPIFGKEQAHKRPANSASPMRPPNQELAQTSFNRGRLPQRLPNASAAPALLRASARPTVNRAYSTHLRSSSNFSEYVIDLAKSGRSHPPPVPETLGLSG